MTTVSVRYIVNNIDAAIGYYTGHFGFTVQIHPNDMFAMLNRGDLRLLLSGDGVRFRNDIVTGVGGKQIIAEDPSGNPVELFEPFNS